MCRRVSPLIADLPRHVSRETAALHLPVFHVKRSGPAVEVRARRAGDGRQERVGLDRRSPWVEDRVNRRRSRDLGGRIFTMYKFRTMTVQETGTPEVWASRNDPRITRIGAFLRKTSLDELPQIFNVLKGDMSIVGPRPTSFDASTYALWHTERLEVVPGITGLWQVAGRSDVDFDDRVKLDGEYIRRQSFWFDLQIIFWTLAAVVTRRGAY